MWEQLAVQGGPYGLIALTVVSLIRGWLIPRSTHRDRIADLKAAIEAKDATIAEMREQMSILLGASAKQREPMG